MRFWRKVIAITWKNALSEMRTKGTVSSVLVFVLLVIVIFLDVLSFQLAAITALATVGFVTVGTLFLALA